MYLIIYLVKSLLYCLPLLFGYIIVYQHFGLPEYFFSFIKLCIISMIAAMISNLKYCHKKKRLKKIDKMTGDEFEQYLCKYFQTKGYAAQVTKKSRDFGADIILDRYGHRTVVQVKRYKNKVSLSAVQEVIGAIAYYKAEKGMVITNSYFTKSAKELAKVNNIELLDRDYIAKYVSK